MAYAIVEKTGCVVHKGNVQLRLDFFLEPGDPRYEDTYIPVIGPETEEPTGECRLIPFHSHFIYLPPTFTDKDIEAEIAFHLPNFYKAFQDGWDKVAGGMRHGWAIEKRIPPEDYSQDAKKVAQCQDRVDSLTEFSYKPEEEGEGREHPATAIDVGPGAINRPNSYGSGNTMIAKGNPANDTGALDTFEVWASGPSMTGTNKVGTFYGSGTTYTNRDGETIGTVVYGAKRTFTGLSIAVAIGDFAGIYYSAGSIEYDGSSGVGVYIKSGDQFGTGEQTYSSIGTTDISIYGSGATLIAPTGITQPAINIGSTTARINGKISDDGGASCEARFRYRTGETEILRPNAAGSECGIGIQSGCSACPDHYTCVDEESADDNTSYVRHEGGTQRDLYALPNHSGSGTINKITVHARCKHYYAKAESGVKLSIRTHDTTYDGDLQDAELDWTNYSEEWENNPNTDAPWTWEEIDALEIGVALVGSVDDGYCTQVYVEIKYWTITDWQNTLETNDEYYEDLTGLNPGTEYEFQTQAKNSVGEGAWSESAYFDTLAGIHSFGIILG